MSAVDGTKKAPPKRARASSWAELMPGDRLWTRLPNEVIRQNIGLTLAEHRTLLMLLSWLDWSDPGKGFKLSLRSLAEHSGLGERTVRRARDVLVERGFLTVEAAGAAYDRRDSYRIDLDALAAEYDLRGRSYSPRGHHDRKVTMTASTRSPRPHARGHHDRDIRKEPVEATEGKKNLPNPPARRRERSYTAETQTETITYRGAQLRPKPEQWAHLTDRQWQARIAVGAPDEYIGSASDWRKLGQAQQIAYESGRRQRTIRRNRTEL